MQDYWFLFPHIFLAGLILLFFAIRAGLLWHERWQRRRWSPYVMRYGAANYWGTSRSNFRRP